MHKSQDKFKIKKKIRIKSLEAAICNVALFKSMKDKDFKDTIFISYSQQGVILQAVNQAQWKKAHDHIQNFLQNKKIELLTDGYNKEVYESLINKGLKQITRRIRQADEQCPYINIIHYQKLRKSCQYMDKQKYVQPLKDWQKKNKKNPNFAFLIVEPKSRYQQIKNNLLEHLYNQPINFNQHIIQPLTFMYLLFYSPQKQVIRNNFNRRQIQIFVKKDQQEKQGIMIVNYTNINLDQYTYSIIKGQSNITKSGIGFQVIPISEIKNEIKNAKLYCKQNPAQIIQKQVLQLEKKHGQKFYFVPYKKQQEEKFKSLIQKYTNSKLSKQQMQRKIQQHRLFQFQQIQFIDQIAGNTNHKTWKALIRGCPYMIHQYHSSDIDMETFTIYLDQLQIFYCAYLVRYHGLIIKKYRSKQNFNSQEAISYLLVFGYHQNNLDDLIENDMILDNMQIANIVLQILFLVNFLHSQQQPRCLGPISTSQIYWPMAIVLPYLGVANTETLYSVQNDVIQVGKILKQLLKQQNCDDLTPIMQQMLNTNKYERPSIKKYISQLQQLLCL